ncbi:NADPH-dependent FMN reductase [Sediminicola sp. 1XM1-17]|uniref:NADPH-dependent FMN reductase n=1 Tax=Sediminicola sp. 1XM1-17 TaxID=3127702 RepID=UPI00307699F8
MASILAFAGSNSSTSINYKLVKYTSGLVGENEIKLMDLSTLPVPMFSEDVEKAHGYPNDMVALNEDIKKADGLMISVNEHNSGPSAYFKNLMDWLSRVDKRFLADKKILLMSASPGKRGAQSALTYVKDTLPRFGGEVVATFSLPSFKDNFSSEEGILDETLKNGHQEALQVFLNSI